MADQDGLTRRAFLAAGAAAAPLAWARASSEPDPSSPAGLPARDAYPLAPGVTYLNHASIGVMPTAVRDALIANIRTQETNPWLHQWGPAWAEPVEAAHAEAAAFLGAPADGVAINRNTTEAFATLAHGLSLEPGDEVLFSTLNHVGASAVWHEAADRRGFTVRVFEFPIREAPGLTADDVVRLHTDEISAETRVLVLPHADNTIGLRHPVAAIARAARRRGVEIIAVDAAQTVGLLRVDAPATGADWLATSAHKNLQSPKGLGLLSASETARAAVRPTVVTWGRGRWAGSARAYTDYGTRDLPSLLALRDCFTFQDALGRDRIEGHVRRLRDRLRDRVGDEPGLSWRSPRSWAMGCGLALVGVGRADPRVVADRLFREHGIVVRPFADGPAEGLRVSVHALNSAADVDRFVEAASRLARAG
ncbi:MAG: aminotransferase class V-fold PLP-dependent enzyme [Planctomycetota bacterium]|nr:MAG: aminotransferase class V-fold PLP-dependent enzyme [Planctomycetota bacterium]